MSLPDLYHFNCDFVIQFCCGESIRNHWLVAIMSAYSQLPHPPSFEMSKFTLETLQKDQEYLVELLRLSKLGPKTYENMRSDGKYGVTYEWMAEAKEYWENQFSW